MLNTLSPEAVFQVSRKVVPREIGGKLIIVPIEDGVANFNDAIFSFNETGRRIWECIGEQMSLEGICATLSAEYDQKSPVIELGVHKLIHILLEKGIIETCKS